MANPWRRLVAALQVLLCDIVSGGFTHTLSGHRAAVWAVHWSPANEWQLVTGAAPWTISGLPGSPCAVCGMVWLLLNHLNLMLCVLLLPAE